MLFRTNTGVLIEIKKYDLPNDKLYYQKIMEIKKPFTKLIEKDNKNKNMDNNYSNYIIQKLVTTQ